MKRVVTIRFTNRFNDAERLLGMFSGTGFKLESINLEKSERDETSVMTVVTDTKGKNFENLLIRIRQQVRVVSARSEEIERPEMEKRRP